MKDRIVSEPVKQKWVSTFLQYVT